MGILRYQVTRGPLCSLGGAWGRGRNGNLVGEGGPQAPLGLGDHALSGQRVWLPESARPLPQFPLLAVG